MSSQSSSGSTPSQTTSPGGEQSGSGGNNNSLYLVTFLATLFLLLFVSCAIVLRSYIFRRRYRRRLEEAMAAGMLLAPRSPGSKRKRFGAKPKMFDLWFKEGEENWEDVLPVAAQPVFVKRKYKEGTGPKATGADGQVAPGFIEILSNATPQPVSSPSRLNVRSLFRRFNRWPSPPTPPNERGDVELAANPGLPNTAASSTPGSYKVRVEMIQVSVLIAMPSSSRAQKKYAFDDSKPSFDQVDDESEEPLPEVAVGIARLNYRQVKPLTPPTTAPSTMPATAVPTPSGEATQSQANFGTYF